MISCCLSKKNEILRGEHHQTLTPQTAEETESVKFLINL